MQKNPKNIYNNVIYLNEYAVGLSYYTTFPKRVFIKEGTKALCKDLF